MAIWVVAAAASGLIGVTMGAAAAHWLPGDIETLRRGWIRTAVDYQMWHALALLGVAVLIPQSRPGRRRALTLAGAGFLIGTVLFSGSLYLLALTDLRGFGWVTPIGGVAFLVGWAALGWHGIDRWRRPPDAIP